MARTLTVRVDAGVLLAAKKRALDEGITMSEIVRRVLAMYAKGTLNVPRRGAE